MLTLGRLRRHRISATLLRLAMMFCAWQGPFPYWHAHDAAAGAAECSLSLAEHLKNLHGGAPCSPECLAGHWHFEYPHSPDDGEPTSHPGKDRLATLAAAGAQFTAPDTGAATSSPLYAIVPHDTDTGLLDAPGANRAVHFFDGFAPTLPPPLRFGVARC